MATYVENAVLKIVDQSSGPLRKVNTALAKLHAEAKKLGSVNLGAMTAGAGLDKLAVDAKSASRALASLNKRTHITVDTAKAEANISRLNNELLRTRTLSNIRGNINMPGPRAAGVHAGGGATVPGPRTAGGHRVRGWRGGVSFHGGAQSLGHAYAHSYVDNPETWGRVAGAYAGLHMGEALVHHAAERQNAEQLLRQQGLTKEQMEHAQKKADEITAKYPTISKTEALEGYSKSIPILGSVHHADTVGADAMAEAYAMMKRLNPDDSKKAQAEAEAIVKSMELQNKANQKDMSSGIRSVAVVRSLYGETLDARRYLQFQRGVGVGWFNNMSDEFKYGVAPALAQENPGFGTGVRRMTRGIFGNKKLSDAEIDSLKSLGLYDANNGPRGGGTKEWQDLFLNDPTKAADLYMERLAKREHLDTKKDEHGNYSPALIKAALLESGRSFGDSNAANMLQVLVGGKGKLEKDRQLYLEQGPAVRAALEGIFKDPTTYDGAKMVLSERMDNLFAALGKQTTDGLVPVMNAISKGAGGLGAYIEKHPAAGTAGLVGGTAAAIYGGGKLMGWLTGASQMQGAARSHMGAAAALRSAAATLTRGAFAGGAGVVPGAGPAANPGFWRSRAGKVLRGMGVLGGAVSVLSMLADDANATGLDGATVEKQHTKMEALQKVLTGAGVGLMAGPYGALAGAIGGGLAVGWDHLSQETRDKITEAFDRAAATTGDAAGKFYNGIVQPTLDGLAKVKGSLEKAAPGTPQDPLVGEVTLGAVSTPDQTGGSINYEKSAWSMPYQAAQDLSVSAEQLQAAAQAISSLSSLPEAGRKGPGGLYGPEGAGEVTTSVPPPPIGWVASIANFIAGWNNPAPPPQQPALMAWDPGSVAQSIPQTFQENAFSSATIIEGAAAQAQGTIVGAGSQAGAEAVNALSGAAGGIGSAIGEAAAAAISAATVNVNVNGAASGPSDRKGTSGPNIPLQR